MNQQVEFVEEPPREGGYDDDEDEEEVPESGGGFVLQPFVKRPRRRQPRPISHGGEGLIQATLAAKYGTEGNLKEKLDPGTRDKIAGDLVEEALLPGVSEAVERVFGRWVSSTCTIYTNVEVYPVNAGSILLGGNLAELDFMVVDNRRRVRALVSAKLNSAQCNFATDREHLRKIAEGIRHRSISSLTQKQQAELTASLFENREVPPTLAGFRAIFQRPQKVRPITQDLEIDLDVRGLNPDLIPVWKGSAREPYCPCMACRGPRRLVNVGTSKDGRLPPVHIMITDTAETIRKRSDKAYEAFKKAKENGKR
ncbi:hypothetical protein JYK02_36015 [Corallococcus macrosporus]|uniref:Uncharacterized protein n=1 Tax=Corallococcus macrosporus TaxID=35 RepID=A0ABS3DNM2_9BACT|nr:hypothetical protein [Corallococcus macrosporus]MBN8232933.1 hypothetical protein [Corallococcus macrosporus]